MKFITLGFFTLMVFLFVSSSALRLSSLQTNAIEISTTPISTDLKFVRYTLKLPPKNIPSDVFTYMLSFTSTNLPIQVNNVEISIVQVSKYSTAGFSETRFKTSDISVKGKDGSFSLSDYSIKFPALPDSDYTIADRQIIFDFDLTSFLDKSPHFTATLTGGDKTYTSGETEATVHADISNGGSFSMGFALETSTFAPQITKLAKPISLAQTKSLIFSSESPEFKFKQGSESCTINDIQGLATFEPNRFTLPLVNFEALDIKVGETINITCPGAKVEVKQSPHKPARHWVAAVVHADDSSSISQDYTPSEDRLSPDNNPNLIKIIIIVVIILIAVAIIAGGVWLFIKKRKQKQGNQALLNDDEPYSQLQNE